MGLCTGFRTKEEMMPEKHSSKGGSQRPPERHHLEQHVDEQVQYFTDERRREAKPAKLIRPSPQKPKAGEDQS